MSFELYKKHRPKKLSEVIGQNLAIASLRKAIEEQKVPHSILFSGPSGTGKTTLARILRKHLRCGLSDYSEINTADFRGIDTVREIRKNLNLSPLAGDARIYFIDECHKLSSDAQHALLKMLEDTPEHVWFFLATTDSQKLIKPILTRCTEIRLSPIKDDAIRALVLDVIKKEGFSISEEILWEITEASEGSARKALVILEAVGKLSGDDEQLAAIQHTTLNKDLALQLARSLMTPKITWGEIAAILRKLKDEEPEAIRYCVLGYARAVMVGKNGQTVNLKSAGRAYMISDIFSKNFYDSKQAGLAAACWEVINNS